MSGSTGSNSVSQSWASILKAAAQRLETDGVPGPMRDARRLLAHTLQIDFSRITLAIADSPNQNDIVRFQQLIEKRVARQPVSQLVGVREFFGRDFAVTPDVLDPRPDTETLIEQALGVAFETALDLGTGSGCILISLLCERPTATGVGVDSAAAAVKMAQKNAQTLGVSARSKIKVSNWYDQVDGFFDLIVANPPYVTAKEYAELAPELRLWEPKQALTPGGDGLDAYRKIISGAGNHLRPGGALVMEIGQSQGRVVQKLLARSGFTNIRVATDIDGHDRVVSGKYPGNNPP